MIRNRPIYHCVCCGSVVLQDAYRLPPFCCGQEMVKAAEEAMHEQLSRNLEVEPLIDEARLSPRCNEPEPISV